MIVYKAISVQKWNRCVCQARFIITQIQQQHLRVLHPVRPLPISHSVSHAIYLTLSLSYRMELLSTTFKWFKSFDLISIILKNSISLCILLYYYNTQSERVAETATAKEEEREGECVCVCGRERQLVNA